MFEKKHLKLPYRLTNYILQKGIVCLLFKNSCSLDMVVTTESYEPISHDNYCYSSLC